MIVNYMNVYNAATYLPKLLLIAGHILRLLAWGLLCIVIFRCGLRLRIGLWSRHYRIGRFGLTICVEICNERLDGSNIVPHPPLYAT